MKTVLITGAGGNLGGAVVKRFVADGYQVVAVVTPGRKPTESTTCVEFFEADLVQEAMVEAMVGKVIEKYKTLDALLLLAGGYEGGNIEKTDGASVKRMHALNFETAYYIARTVFNQMMKQSGGGRIVFIGARPAIEASGGKTAIAYGLSKSLLFKLSEYLNAAGAENNVVTYVAVPSTIDTPPNRQAMPKADFSTWQKPEDIAGVLAGLAKTESVVSEKVVRLYEKK